MVVQMTKRKEKILKFLTSFQHPDHTPAEEGRERRRAQRRGGSVLASFLERALPFKISVLLLGQMLYPSSRLTLVQRRRKRKKDIQEVVCLWLSKFEDKNT